jgi:hypothetical protein
MELTKKEGKLDKNFLEIKFNKSKVLEVNFFLINYFINDHTGLSSLKYKRGVEKKRFFNKI